MIRFLRHEDSYQQDNKYHSDNNIIKNNMTQLFNNSKKKCRNGGRYRLRTALAVILCGLAFCKSVAQDKIDIDVD